MRGRGSRIGGGLIAGLLAVLTIVVGIPLNVVSGYLPAAVAERRLLWIGLLAAGTVAVTVLSLISRSGEGPLRGAAAGQVPPLAGWVNRPELAKVVSALTSRASGSVVLTTGLVGAGGFGKTTLAARACRDRRVRQVFRGGIVWVTVGREVDEAALAARIAEEVRNLGGREATFTSLEGAGHGLARVLQEQGGRTLLVADDVWTASQLAPFMLAGQAGRLLVTTRRPRLLDGLGVRRIEVDAVSDDVARRLLGASLPQIADAQERELLELAGGWPLLLSLINARLAHDLRNPDSALDAVAASAVGRLRRDGPAALDIGDPGSRQKAVAATIEYSLAGLDLSGRQRFLELGILAEDAEVPVTTVALLWRGTAALSEAESTALCEGMEGLSLVSLASAGTVLVIHDVLRDYAAECLGPRRRAAAHAAFIGAGRSLVDDHSPGQHTNWWRLPWNGDGRYLSQHLISHLKAAGLTGEIDELCCDLRFIAIMLRRSGPVAVEADLARSKSPVARQIRRAIARNAHLLGPVRPATALTSVLTSRLDDVSGVQDQLLALRSDLDVWTACPDEPLPDQSPALVRTLSARSGTVGTVAVSPDGTWLASGNSDKTVRIWAADGKPGPVFSGSSNGVFTVAIAPDGTWLASGGYGDGTVRIWSRNGTPGPVLAGHADSVNAVAISPDGTWLASASEDKTVRIWAADGKPGPVLSGHSRGADAVAIAPDGTWLASASQDKTVRIWTADGKPGPILSGHLDGVRAIAIAPDGTWLASASEDKTVRIWTADGKPGPILSGHLGGVWTVAIAPDGTWLASGGTDNTVRIWTPSGKPGAILSGHSDYVRAVAIAPDGTWLASSANDGTLRIWSAEEALRPTASVQLGWAGAMAVSPDGSWLASAGEDDTVRIWMSDGKPGPVLAAHSGRVRAIAISPDGRWLASAGEDDTVRICTIAGKPGRVLLHMHRTALGFLPDGNRLASASYGAVEIQAKGPPWVAIGAGNRKYARISAGQQMGEVSAIAFSPDNRWLATGGKDHAVRVWTSDGKPGPVLTGHSSWVHALAICPEGKLLASASLDKTVRIWSPWETSVKNVAVMRIDDKPMACAWLSSTVLGVAASKGIYRFSIISPQ